MTEEIDWLVHEGAVGTAPNQQWNLLTQILVPIVILLAFAALLEVGRYQLINNEQIKTIENLKRANNELRAENADLRQKDDTMQRPFEEQLIEAQKQRLLRELEHEFARQRTILGFAGHESIDRVVIHGGHIDDDAFRMLCANVRNEVADTGWRRASPRFILTIYRTVLRNADLGDSLIHDDTQIAAFAEAAASDFPHWPGVPFERLMRGQITPTNRTFILEEIARAAVQLQDELATLQQQVLVQIYKAIIQEPHELDHTARELIGRMQQPGLAQNEWARLARDFHRQFNAWVRSQLEPTDVPENKQYVTTQVA